MANSEWGDASTPFAIRHFATRLMQSSGTMCRESVPYFVIAGLDPAIHADTPHARSGVFVRCTSAWITGSSPVVTTKESDPEGLCREGGEGDRSSKPPQFPSPVRRLAMAKPGANASREQRRPARPLLQCGRGQRSHIRPSNKCPASRICMTWGRGQTQNVHRPCSSVCARTAISRMRRSARVQRGRAIFCSIAAGANCRSVACARSAH